MLHRGTTTWVLVAHRAGARLFQHDGPGKGLRLLEEIDHEDGRLRASDVDTDKPGRALDRSKYGRSAMERHESPTERIAHDFARRLADRLRDARNGNQYDRLMLVAEPSFLGMLRDALDAPTLALVAASLSKDLGSVNGKDLDRHLSEILAV